jgi:hypothetical protein
MKALLTSYNLSHFFISVIMVEEMTFGLIGNFAEQLLGAHHMNAGKITSLAITMTCAAVMFIQVAVYFSIRLLGLLTRNPKR